FFGGVQFSKLKALAILALLLLSMSFLSMPSVKAERTIIWAQNTTTTFPELAGAGCAVAVDASGVYVVGYGLPAGVTTNVGWRIEKKNLIDGSNITTFGSNGVVGENPSSGDDQANAIAVDG